MGFPTKNFLKKKNEKEQAQFKKAWLKHPLKNNKRIKAEDFSPPHFIIMGKYGRKGDTKKFKCWNNNGTNQDDHIEIKMFDYWGGGGWRLWNDVRFWTAVFSGKLRRENYSIDGRYNRVPKSYKFQEKRIPN